MKTLKQLLEKSAEVKPVPPTGGYYPKPKDEKRFMDKHVIAKKQDANGNKDDVFNATNVKAVDRTPEHGYNPGQDAAVYEQQETSNESLNEKKLTPAEMKKREEVARAMERENPGMNKSKKMAIATATAKRVAEETEELSEEDQIVEFINQFYEELDDNNKVIFEELAQEQDVEEILKLIDEVLNGDANG